MERQKLQIIINDMEAALKAVGEKHKVVIKSGGGTYGEGHAIAKFKIDTIAEDGTVESKETSDFKKYATIYGLKPEQLGATFVSRGREFELTGLAMRRRKFPIMARDVQTNKTLLFPTTVVAIINATKI